MRITTDLQSGVCIHSGLSPPHSVTINWCSNGLQPAAQDLRVAVSSHPAENTRETLGVDHAPLVPLRAGLPLELGSLSLQGEELPELVPGVPLGSLLLPGSLPGTPGVLVPCGSISSLAPGEVTSPASRGPHPSDRGHVNTAAKSRTGAPKNYCSILPPRAREQRVQQEAAFISACTDLVEPNPKASNRVQQVLSYIPCYMLTPSLPYRGIYILIGYSINKMVT